MIFKNVIEIGHEREGYVFLKQVVGNPTRELLIFSNGKSHYIGKAVHDLTGKIVGHRKISDLYKTFEEARIVREYLVKRYIGKCDYFIKDYLYEDDVFVKGFQLTQDQQSKVIIGKGE